MANRLRFRSGQVQLLKFRVESATVIEAGDLLFLDGHFIKPANDFPWGGDIATTQAAFTASFVGVSHQQSMAGDTDDVSVDLSPHSVYEFDVAFGTYEVGDALGPDELSSALMNQQFEKAKTTYSIARAAEYKADTVTRLRVTFASAFHTGSANRNAAIGVR